MYNGSRGPWGGDAQLGASNSQGNTFGGGGKDWQLAMLAASQQDQFRIGQ